MPVFALRRSRRQWSMSVAENTGKSAGQQTLPCAKRRDRFEKQLAGARLVAEKAGAAFRAAMTSCRCVMSRGPGGENEATDAPERAVHTERALNSSRWGMP
jgi:hypothetical protein